jgi:hypothetical protein
MDKVRLYLRLTAEVNDRLRESMRHRGDLSRQIDEALSSTDLATVELNTIPPGRTANALTAIVSCRADRQLRNTARQRSCTVTALANSVLSKWLGETRA